MNEKTPLLSPQAVWGSQLDNLRKFGYPLPAYDEIAFEIPLPDAEKLKLGPVLLVDYETPIGKQCELLGIKDRLKRNRYTDLHCCKSQGRWVWIYGVEDGRKLFGKSPNQSIDELTKCHRRGLMTVEGLALYRENPAILNSHSIDLPGSRCGKFGASVPAMSIRNGQFTLRSGGARFCGSQWGSASCVIE